MNKQIEIKVLFLSVLFLVCAELSPAENLTDLVSGNIRARINAAEVSSQSACVDAVLWRSELLPKFYAEREFRPAWNDDYAPIPYVEDFLEVISEADREGLKPEDYHLNEIKRALSALYESQSRELTFEESKLANVDLMLTDAFLLYASHLFEGRVDHQKVYPDWVVNQRMIDLAAVLQRALESGDMKGTLSELAPRHPGYARLKKKLIEYQNVAETGGWLRIPKGSKLTKGSRGRGVAILRQRLIASGDLNLTAVDKNNVFDHNLEGAIRRFQKRHGLRVDGRVGRSTIEALNVPAEVRMRQIALNMDRMRWLADDSEGRYIFVNIADFRLEVVEDEKTILEMKIIAGKGERRSCVLSAKMTYLELNPYWRIPDGIASREILPQVKKNTRYLAEKRIKVFRDWVDDGKELNPKKVKWSRVKAGDPGYKFPQDPGPSNPLGRLKFIFPNLCEIYLHDMPARHLFGRSRRDFSHGCIRIEKPIELATYLLQDKETWTRKKILDENRTEKRQVVMLPEPISVHIFYGTAWVDSGGHLQFRDDIYHVDEIPYELPVSKVRTSAVSR
jgi:murein L,D-transpeptidase YcbB/YkuD